ncbi:class I SAM-dependent methyltransferase [Microvirga sp. 0TCS3.31]
MSLNHSFIIDLAVRYLPPPGRFLDFGCGTADLAAIAVGHGYDAYGVDTFLGVGDSSENLKIATGRIGSRAMAIDPDKRMPFEDSFFDIVASNQVFEHVPELDGICSEIARVTRPGGILLALMPTSEVLWEDHLKMPWVHRLPVGSERQRMLVKAFRQMGFGTARQASDDEWLNRADTILREEVFHRPVREYVSAFSKNFRLLAEDEPAWARYRIKRHPLLKYSSALSEFPGADSLIRQAVRRAAGAVLVLQRLP